MYYIHLHGNYGYLYVLLPGTTDWLCWNIEYAPDALYEIKDSKAQELTMNDLPEEITGSFDFSRLAPHIKHIYKITE